MKTFEIHPDPVTIAEVNNHGELVEFNNKGLRDNIASFSQLGLTIKVLEALADKLEYLNYDQYYINDHEDYRVTLTDYIRDFTIIPPEKATYNDR